MAPGGALTLAAPPPRLVRLAVKLATRGPSVALREIRKWHLRRAYMHGAARARSATFEETDPALVSTGRALRDELLRTAEGRHAALGYRVLMLQPSSITADIWFGDLARCMNHLGVACRLLRADATSAVLHAAFEEFQPNVFIAAEAPESLQAVDLPRLERYKRERGCLRLLVPVWHANAPRKDVPGSRPTAAQDEWRRALRHKGLLADAHLSIFEPEFHERFAADPAAPVEYAVIPMAANPFVDFPVAAVKRYDYFMAASMTDERVEVAARFLWHVLRGYQGLWAGPSWGFGLHSIPHAEMPRHYAESRIALSPLVGFVHRYAAELTHRVFAAAACGAFQITMPTAVTGRFFAPQELVQAATPEEYARLFDHYVERPLERNAIALAALRRAYAEHTCIHRVDKLVSHWNDWRRRGMF